MKTITIVLEGEHERAYDYGIKLLKPIRKPELGPDITNGEHCSMLTGGLFAVLEMIASQMKILYKELSDEHKSS